MLDDRKFFYPVVPKELVDSEGGSPRESGFGPRRGVGPGRWNPIGPANSVKMDTNKPFVGEHSPLIVLGGEEPRGILQDGVVFEKGASYKGRIHLAGDPRAKVFVRVCWSDSGGNLKAATVVPIAEAGQLSSEFRRFDFALVADESGAARFEIVGTGSGWFKGGGGFSHANKQSVRV